jgi:hypothetical protein
MKRRRHGVAVVAALAGLVLVAGLSAGAVARGSTAVTACRLGGIRYVGTTSQKQVLCLTLSANRKILREYVYDYIDSCGTGQIRAFNPIAGLAPVTGTGGFTRTSFDGFFKGVARARTASGTLRQKTEETIPGKGTAACDTKIVRWTAHRIG